jgi:hypothetical protein
MITTSLHCLHLLVKRMMNRLLVCPECPPIKHPHQSNRSIKNKAARRRGGDRARTSLIKVNVMHPTKFNRQMHKRHRLL